MLTVAVINEKGGVGKTTTAVNLAGALHELGWRVLLVDLDPQGSANDWLKVPEDIVQEGRPLREAVLGRKPLETLVLETPLGFDFLPGGESLRKMHLEAPKVGFKYLAQALQATEQLWDFVVLDTPGTKDFLFESALYASDTIIIPTQAEAMSVRPLANTIRELERQADELEKENLHLCGILATQVDMRTNLARDHIKLYRETFGDLVLDTFIRKNVAIAEAPAQHLAIGAHAAQSAGAEDHAKLAEEFLRRLGLETKHGEVANG